MEWFKKLGKWVKDQLVHPVVSYLEEGDSVKLELADGQIINGIVVNMHMYRLGYVYFIKDENSVVHTIKYFPEKEIKHPVKITRGAKYNTYQSDKIPLHDLMFLNN